MSDELERLRQERIKQLMMQQQQAQEQQQIEQLRAAEIEKQIKLIVNKILTPEARERLSNLRLARPEFARQIEIFLIQLYQAGRLPNKITDEQLKDILMKISSRKRNIKIRRI